MQNKLTNYVYLTELVLNFILLLILVFTPNYETEYCLEWGVLIVISIICLIISNRYRTNSFWVHILGYMAISGCICYMYYSHPELRIYLAILVVIYLVKYVLILSKKYTLIVYLFFIFQFINFYRISYHSQNLVDGNEVTLYYYIVFILTGTIAEIIALCWKDSVIKTKYGVDASQSKNILPNIDILNSNNGLDTRVVKTITTASNDGLLGIQKKVQSKRNEIVDINLSIGTWLKDFEKNILNKYKTIDFIPLPKNKFIYADVNSLSRVIRSLLEISDTKLYGKIIKLQIDIYKKPNEQNYLIISILSNKSKNKVQNLYRSINIKNKTLDNKISDCKQLVQAINGVFVKLEFQNDLEITIKLPIKLAAKDYEKKNINWLKLANIGVAEDDTVNVIILKKLFKNFKTKLFIYSNGREFLDNVLKDYGKYDVVLMDIQMPILNGYETTIALRKFEKENNLPPKVIIAMTANVLQSDIDKCFECGMDFHLAKPFTIDDLLHIFNQIEDPTKGRLFIN